MYSEDRTEVKDIQLLNYNRLRTIRYCREETWRTARKLAQVRKTWLGISAHEAAMKNTQNQPSIHK